MTFGEIDNLTANLIEQNIDIETGEFIGLDEAEFLESLDMLYKEKDDKIDKLVGAFKYYGMMADGLKGEKQTIEKRQKTFENKRDSVKKVLAYITNGEKYETSQFKISYRTSESAECDVEADALPEAYRKVKYTADLTAIKKAIAEGAEIEGCRVVKKSNIQIK